jgi:hypothetical protein
VDPRVVPFVEAARGYIRRALSVELDLSPESLAYIDHYVTSTRADKSAPLEDDVLRLAAAALGAYFGEVLIGAFGGDWVIAAQDDAHPERWKIELSAPTLSMYPAALAATALVGGDAAGFDDRIVPPFRDAAALEQLLRSTAPVDAELYYSLTGRLEAIEQMRGLLAEIDRRRQAGPPPDESAEEDELN